MMAEVPGFLPDRLRPPTPRRRNRRGYALLTVVPVMLLALPRWQVAEVRVEGCPKLPPAGIESLYEMVGQPTLGLDLQEVRDRVEVWPGVGEVEVELELPGTVRVRARAAVSRGSVRVGRSWHGVAADGSLAGAVDVGLPPIFEGFVSNDDRTEGLAVVSRIEAATGGRVVQIRRVTPLDYQLRFQPPGEGSEMILHVDPRGSGAESAWCAAVAAATVDQPWADLRSADRIVIGGGS